MSVQHEERNRPAWPNPKDATPRSPIGEGYSPLRRLLMVLTVLLVANVGVLKTLHVFWDLPHIYEVALEILIMATTVLPALYFFLYKPLDRSIQEHRAAIGRLEESDAKYRAIVDNIGLGVALISRNRKVLELNKTMRRWFPNVEPADMPLCYGSFNNPPRDKPCPHCRTKDTLRDGQVHEAFTSTTAGNETHHFRVISSGVKDAGDQVVAAVEIVEDITEAKKAEHELLRVHRTLKAINACVHTLVKAADEQELLRDICQIIVDGGYRMAWVGFAEDDDRKTVRPVADAGLEEGYLETVEITWADTERGRGPTGNCIRAGGLAVVHNTQTDPAFRPWREQAAARGYASVAGLPLMLDGAAIGALTVYSSEPDSFHEEELSLLTDLVDSLSYGIAALRTRAENEQAQAFLRESHYRLEQLVEARTTELLRANKELVAEIVDRKQTQQALQKSEERLAMAQHLAHLGCWDWDIPSNQLTWSDEIYRIFGRSPGDFGADYEDFLNAVHPDDRERLQRVVDQVLETGEPYSVVHRIQRPDGSMRMVQEEGHLYPDEDGKPRRLLGTVQDITERMELDARLRLAARVFESAAEGILITDADNRIVEVNEAFTAISGYSRDEVLGNKPSLLRSGRQDKAFYEAMWDDLLNRDQWQGELWNRRKSGEVFPERLSISTIRDENGNITNYVGIFSDITHVKAAEEHLKRLAHHDPLTGLPNRLLFRERLNRAILVAQRNKKKLALLFVDLDGFKPINDAYGHDFGDLLLEAVAERLPNCVRQSDTVARLGGDEFTVLLPEVEGVESATGVAEKIIGVISKPFHLRGEHIQIGCSIGIALYPAHSDEADDLLKKADNAMYRAKETGKGRLYVYDAHDEARNPPAAG